MFQSYFGIKLVKKQNNDHFAIKNRNGIILMAAAAALQLGGERERERRGLR